MRVLVTGASGFVGQHMVQLLSASGDQVVAWGHEDTPHADVVVIDLRQREAVDAQDLRGLDAVIHLAGLAQVSASFQRPAEYISANASMEINLMEALLAQRSCPRVLVVSSGGVYAGGDEVITEDSPVHPANPYVISKLTQEMLARYYTERSLDVIVARPFNHIGPGQQRGYLIADIASQIASLERAGGGELVVGNLDTTRDFTDVRDIATAYAALIHNGKSGEIYNVCSGVSKSGREIVDELVALARAPIRVVEDAGLHRPTDTVKVVASNEKLHSATGWKRAHPLSVTLADVLNYWRERPLSDQPEATG